MGLDKILERMRVYEDGDAYCVVLDDFVDLQTSPAVFYDKDSWQGRILTTWWAATPLIHLPWLELAGIASFLTPTVPNRAGELCPFNGTTAFGGDVENVDTLLKRALHYVECYHLHWPSSGAGDVAEELRQQIAAERVTAPDVAACPACGSINPNQHYATCEIGTMPTPRGGDDPA